MPRFVLAPVLAVLVTFGSGCSVLDAIVGSASGTAGDAIGKSIGDAVARQFTPHIMQIYAQAIFGYAFHAGSGWFEGSDYEPGQWTRWVSSDEAGERASLEKAFLRRTEDGREWWKVKFQGDDGSETILEGLFAPGRTQLVRLRGKFPDQPAGEIPVTEGAAVYHPATRPTEESLAGALVGVESVTVPAGTFDAKHYRYADVSSGGEVDWYLSDAVPGGFVKYSANRSASSAEAGVRAGGAFELEAWGADATTELGSF